MVGEIRDAETAQIAVQSALTGHLVLTTVHANSPRDALARLETMILMAGANLPDRAMREQISSALDLIIQVSRLADGTRKITSVVEVTGMEGPVTATQEIFRYRRRGISPEGQVVGDFETTGVRPQFMERLKVAGVEISNDLFAEAVLR